MLLGLLPPALVDLNPLFLACQGSAGLLVADTLEGYTYLWSVAAAGNTLETDVPGTYVLTATNAFGCSVSDSTVFAFYPIPGLDVVADGLLCEDSTTTVSAISGPGGFAWNTGANTPTIEVSNTGFYTVVYTDSLGCTATDSVRVVTVALPLLFAENSTACQGETVPVEVQSLNSTVYVLPDSLVNQPFQLGPGTYTLVGINDCGATFQSITIAEDPCACEALLPNVFSPNGDGLNDLFTPQINCEAERLELTLFNRWGDQVYQTGTGEKDWKGTTQQGDACSEGVYFYTLIYFNTLRTPFARQVYTGWVQLVR